MFIVCILFLLAVHRLVLIVNSWDAFLGNRRGEEVRPHTTETVFCSGLMNPSVFVYVLFVFSLSWRSRKGSVFCKAEGWEELRTMTKRKITFPLEEKNKKKINGCFACPCIS